MIDNQSDQKKPRYYGYMIDLLNELARQAQFSYEIYIVPDSSYGFRRADGTWDGVINELVANVSM